MASPGQSPVKTCRPSAWLAIAVALLAGGCGVTSSPPRTVEAPAPKPTEMPPSSPAQAPPMPAEAPLPGTTAPAAPSPPKVAPPAKPAPRADARTAPAPAAAPKAPPAAPKAPPVVAAPPAAPPLDLKSLERRLKETSAIGVLTKLTLKNQVDDLVSKFRAYHGGQRPPGLPDLRPSYELLLMKVLSLLQDKDTALAKDIDASRNAIWGVLADRDKFANI